MAGRSLERILTRMELGNLYPFIKNRMFWKLSPLSIRKQATNSIPNSLDYNGSGGQTPSHVSIL